MSTKDGTPKEDLVSTFLFDPLRITVITSSMGIGPRIVSSTDIFCPTFSILRTVAFVPAGHFIIRPRGLVPRSSHCVRDEHHAEMMNFFVLVHGGVFRNNVVR